MAFRHVILADQVASLSCVGSAFDSSLSARTGVMPARPESRLQIKMSIYLGAGLHAKSFNMFLY